MKTKTISTAIMHVLAAVGALSLLSAIAVLANKESIINSKMMQTASIKHFFKTDKDREEQYKLLTGKKEKFETELKELIKQRTAECTTPEDAKQRETKIEVLQSEIKDVETQIDIIGSTLPHDGEGHVVLSGVQAK